jgi:hypothetical protein
MNRDDFPHPSTNCECCITYSTYLLCTYTGKIPGLSLFLSSFHGFFVGTTTQPSWNQRPETGLAAMEPSITIEGIRIVPKEDKVTLKG